MDAFKNIDFSFGNSREGAFVEKLLKVSTSFLRSSLLLCQFIWLCVVIVWCWCKYLLCCVSAITSSCLISAISHAPVHAYITCATTTTIPCTDSGFWDDECRWLPPSMWGLRSHHPPRSLEDFDAIASQEVHLWCIWRGGWWRHRLVINRSIGNR